MPGADGRFAPGAGGERRREAGYIDLVGYWMSTDARPGAWRLSAPEPEQPGLTEKCIHVRLHALDVLVGPMSARFQFCLVLRLPGIGTWM